MRHNPPPYPVRRPSAPTIRWQGMMIESDWRRWPRPRPGRRPAGRSSGRSRRRTSSGRREPSAGPSRRRFERSCPPGPGGGRSRSVSRKNTPRVERRRRKGPGLPGFRSGFLSRKFRSVRNPFFSRSSITPIGESNTEFLFHSSAANPYQSTRFPLLLKTSSHGRINVRIITRST